DHHDRGDRPARSAPSGPGGLSRAPRPPVRVLHARDGPLRHRAADRQPPADRGGDPRRSGRQPVHVHRLRQHRPGRRGRGRGSARARFSRRVERGKVMTESHVGQPVRRTEDLALLVGQGRFIDDVAMPGMAHAAYLRSPYAHARIARVDVRRAAAHPGVFAVLTGDEVARLSRPQRGRVPLANSPQVFALAHRKVCYVGQPVAAVAAVDRATAEDAAELIEVEYEPLPVVVDPERAMEPGAPLVFEEIGSNVLWHGTFPYGDVDGAFARAERVVRERVTLHRYASTPLETFGAIAQLESATGAYTIWGHTQQPGQDLHGVAAALGISPSQVRLIVPPLGGGFGNKVRPLNLIALALLARKAGRPVKWIEDRRESLLALGHSADGVMEVEAAVTNAGVIEAIRVRNIENEGAGIDFAGRHNLLMLTNLVNCYRIPAASYEGYSVVTNRCPVVANRG